MFPQIATTMPMIDDQPAELGLFGTFRAALVREARVASNNEGAIGLGASVVRRGEGASSAFWGTLSGERNVD